MAKFPQNPARLIPLGRTSRADKDRGIGLTLGGGKPGGGGQQIAKVPQRATGLITLCGHHAPSSSGYRISVSLRFRKWPRTEKRRFYKGSWAHSQDIGMLFRGTYCLSRIQVPFQHDGQARPPDEARSMEQLWFGIQAVNVLGRCGHGHAHGQTRPR